MLVQKKCEYCGHLYFVPRYREQKAKFCSRKCASKVIWEKYLKNINQDYKKGNKWRLGKKPSNSFAKGHIPWNKGLKGIHLNPKTEFKKGCVSINHCEIGTVIERNCKGKLRKFIKIAEPNTWKMYYLYLYENAYGKIPKGYVVHHINKISNDDRLENLICVSRAEHINIHRQDLELHKKNENKTLNK